ncbi:MAG: outer membrane protein assembly factor BamA [Treponema sp.]|jgi:outer membrane protein insertion porin family|nr:outer membrane protein assembly factor BamA [Treponema sp.]
MRLVVVMILVVMGAFSGFAQESVEWYQGKPIKTVVFDGLKHVSAAELEGVTEAYIGKAFSDELFLDIQGRLYALEYFELISPSAVPGDLEGNSVILRFTVTERPTASRIIFSGNAHLRRNELLEVVVLKVNDVVNQMKLRLDEFAIQNKYLEKGFPDVQVRSETQLSRDGVSMTVTFFIEEGEKMAIEAFVFEGNSIFSSRTLRGQLSLKAKSLIHDGAFQEAKLIADQGAVTQYYHDRGYIDAAITDVIRETRKDEKDNNYMTITFKIVEGKLYNFAGVEFEGNKIFTTQQLSALIYSRQGEVVNARKVEADLQRVADRYYEDGYIYNAINREPLKDPDNGTIAYKITIVERGRAHIEHILITGQKKTKPEVILREIPLEPGDVFSKTKVLDGMRNLYNLQFFSAVAPDTPPGSEDGLMDLVFTVEEQPTTDIQVGLTFSGTSDPDQWPVSAMLKWNDRNFLGYGNLVGAEVQASWDTQSGSLQYTHRRIFGLPLSGSFDFTAQHTNRRALMDNMAPYFYGDEEAAFPDGFNSYSEYYNAGKIPANEFLMKYTQWKLSVGASTGYVFSTVLGNLSLGVGIRSGIIRNTYDESLYRPFDPTIRERNNQWTPVNSFWASIALDQRDIYYDPSKGYYGIQRVGYYGIFPIEQEHYLRTDTKAEWFLTLINAPVTEKWSFKAVFGIHSGLSFIFPQPFRDKAVVEAVNQLAVDGMFVGRGWNSEYYNKGFALWENWAEIRIPILPGIFAFDFFFDAAGVKDTPTHFFQQFSLEDMRFSFGGGLRFSIPQFPFRLSLAKRFKVVDGVLEWQKGAIFSNDKPASGLDVVFSFALSNY